MKIAITGHKTSIAHEFLAWDWFPMGQPDLEIVNVSRGEPLPADADAYLFCQGYLAGKAAGEISSEEARQTWDDNFGSIAADCDAIIDANLKARICIITSYSGIKGSFDSVYAGAKAAMNLYIQTKRLKYPGQQIVGIAPHIVWDSGMTQRRDDLRDLAERAEFRRRGEWIKAEDVAKLAHFLLFCDSGNITNVVIPVTGGLEE